MFFDGYLNFIVNYQQWGYAIMFLVSVFESLALIGLLVPGTTLTVIAGLMAADGDFNVPILILVCALGAVIGDGLSYLLGRTGKNFVWCGRELLSAANLEIGKNFFERHGNKSVFVGRFIGPLRPLVPFVAGALRVRPAVFYFWNVLSAVVWSVTFVNVGYYFGYAWKSIGAWYGRMGAMLVVCLAVGLVVLSRRLKHKIEKQLVRDDTGSST